MEESASREIQLATASRNNEDQNTQKEANLSGENENENDELVIEIREMFERPEIQSLTPGRIYKVPHHLRKWNEEAYTPQVISIGPFYHKNERLKAMEEHKERYFRSFVNRSNINLEYLVGTIREMEKIIRGCYEETIDLTSDRFVKMILVDACFILELLFKCSSGSQTSDDPVIEEPRATIVMIDLLLLENQLPFIVLDKLHHFVFPSLPDNALLELSILYFGKKFISEHTTLPKNLKIEHFTDLVRTFLLPPPEKRPKGDKKLPEHYLFSASQLHKAGVKFRHAECECDFDIKFEKGVLEIPTLVLNDLTEVVFRNIMALEQTCHIENAYFVDYFFFMDLLINTGKYVDLLCGKKILVNFLGDNNAATFMINNLNKGIMGKKLRTDYIDLCEKLNSFYENPWHRWKATLKREYFSTPWRGASTMAAIILLVLTFIQTVFTIKSSNSSSGNSSNCTKAT